MLLMVRGVCNTAEAFHLGLCDPYLFLSDVGFDCMVRGLLQRMYCELIYEVIGEDPDYRKKNYYYIMTSRRLAIVRTECDVFRHIMNVGKRVESNPE
jgi:hypothetical protein